MSYTISYDMAIELVRGHVERIYALNKHKHTNIVKVAKLFDLNIDLQDLLNQLRSDGHDVDAILDTMKSSMKLKYDYDKITINIDGSARGNENPAKDNVSGLAFVVYGDGELLHEETVCLGATITLPKLRNEPFSRKAETTATTNNVAEYMALIHALEYLLRNELNAKHIEILSDSGIVVQQVNKENSTRYPHLVRLRNCAWDLMDQFENLTLTHIPREENDYVDTLLCLFLDHLQGIKRDPTTRRVIRDNYRPSYV